MNSHTGQKNQATVREVTLELLRSFGITTVFGNPGSTELAFFKDWPRDFRYILGLQEAAVVAMADGYAQATGNAAFVNLHSAAGLGHALGNIMTASHNRTPLVITAGQQTRALLPTEPYLFALSATEFPKPYVKWSNEPARAEDVPAAIARAYYTAMQRPCGPTFVSIPADDWDATTEYVIPRTVTTQYAPDPTALQAVADALNTSKNPALIVGAGVDQDHAWEQVIELAEHTHARVWASPLSGHASFPEDHSQFAGFLPPVRGELARTLEGHDVLIAIACPVFTYHVSSGGPVIPQGSRLFQITDDVASTTWAPVGTSIITTIQLGLKTLLPLIKETRRPIPPARQAVPTPRPTDPISAAFVMHTVAQLMPADAIIVEEAPSHRNDLHDYLPIRTNGGFYAGASGGLGYALPAAIGIALGTPGRKVICLVGDGSSMYTIQGLYTAACHKLPVTFVVFHNGKYAALESFSELLSIAGVPGIELPGLDIAKIAEGHGISARRIEKATDLAPALEKALANEKESTLLDVIVDPSATALHNLQLYLANSLE